MSRCPRLLAGAALLLFCASFSFTGWGQEGMSLEELWVTEREAAPLQGLRMQADFPDRMPASGAVEFAYIVVSEYNEPKAHLVFRLTGADGAPVVSLQGGESGLRPGENRFVFSWQGAPELAPGMYEAVAELFLDEKTPAAATTLRLERVSSRHMAEQARQAGALLRESVPDSVRAASPHVRARAAVLEDAVASLEGLLAGEDWEAAVRQTAHVRASLDALRSFMALGGLVPELRQEIPGLAVTLGASGVTDASGEAACLMGENLRQMPEESWKGVLERMPRFGLNFAVLPVSEMDSAAAAPFDTDRLRGAVLPLLDTAAAGGIGVVVQLSQDALADTIRDQAPGAREPGFANLAHPSLLAAFKEHAAAAARAVGGHPALLGISIADAPQFKFDGEQVRLSFVEEIRTANPDRQELNRAWRAHLAEYGEITVWGDHPEHAYQNRRAYQFDWQSFHHTLIHALVRDLRDTVAAAAPGTPLMLTLPANAFQKAETRHSPDREVTAGMFDALACAQSLASGEDVYAWNYPRPAVSHALLASFAPEKPLFDLSVALDALPEAASPSEREAVVRSLLWTSLVTGASGLALDLSPELQEVPGVMEGFSRTALEARRLAPVVRALQRAPAATHILYSSSSKIFDDGVPHLSSAEFAYEGCSFSGHAVRFVTERQLASGDVGGMKALVMPETPAITDAAFKALAGFVEADGTVLRVGTPIPYNERGHSRTNVIRNTGNTVLVRGMNMPTEYLHAMDAAIQQGTLPPIPRPINTHGYPLEGVFTRYVVHEGVSHLFCVNLRKTPVRCHLDGNLFRGRDLLVGRDVQFPRTLESCDPMLIQLERPEQVVETVAAR